MNLMKFVVLLLDVVRKFRKELGKVAKRKIEGLVSPLKY